MSSYANTVTKIAGGLSAFLGLAVMAGWFTGSIMLVKIAPAFPAMQLNTALGLFLCGTGLLSVPLGLPRLSTACGTIVSSLGGLLTLIQYTFGVNLGIDQLLMKDYISPGITYSGRMAPNTALNFTLAGMSLLIMGTTRPRQRSLILGFLGSIVIAFAVVALSNYAMGIKTAYVWGYYIGTGMAVHTATGFAIIGIGVISFAWEAGRVEGLRSPQWLPVLIGIGALAMTFIMWQSLMQSEHAHIRELTRMAASSMRHDIGEQVKVRTMALARMAKRVERREPQREEWESDANLYLAHYQAIQTIHWLAPSFNTRWSVYRRNGEIGGYGIESIRENKEALQVLERGEAPVVRTGRWLNIYLPISKEKGFIVGVFDAKRLLEIILTDESTRRYSVRIEDGDDVVYIRHEGGEHQRGWEEEDEVYLYGKVLRIVAWPSAGLLSEIKSSLPEAVLAAGLILSSLLVISVYLGQKARLHAMKVEEARRELQRNEGLLKEAQRMAHIGNWELDLVNNVLTWSDEIYRIFEIDPNRFGASYEAFMDAIHPEDRAMVGDAYTNSLKTRTTYSIDHRLLFPDGRIKYVHEQCETSYDNEGKPLRSAGTVQDITDRKEAEEEIRKLNIELEHRVLERTAELSAANKELEAFSYSVSHDLRAPLRHVVGYVEMLQKSSSSALDETGGRYLKTIADSARRMGVLIDDLLAFSRAGRSEMKKTAVNLDRLVKEVTHDLHKETEGRSIAWKVGPLPTVSGDQAMLKLVLVNLISNAVKYTRKREKTEIEIGYSDGKGDNVVVFIKDNGVGFDMKYADKLFGVFQRLHRQDEFEGIGIGLANVRRIIHRHGGRTWADGALNEGATFYFSLPRLRRIDHD